MYVKPDATATEVIVSIIETQVFKVDARLAPQLEDQTSTPASSIPRGRCATAKGILFKALRVAVRVLPRQQLSGRHPTGCEGNVYARNGRHGCAVVRWQPDLQ